MNRSELRESAYKMHSRFGLFPRNDPDLKRCPQCRETFSKKEFPVKDNGFRSGLCSRCLAHIRKKREERPWTWVDSFTKTFLQCTPKEDRGLLNARIVRGLAVRQGYKCFLTNEPMTVPRDGIKNGWGWKRVLFHQRIDPDEVPKLIKIKPRLWKQDNIALIKAANSQLPEFIAKYADIQTVTLPDSDADHANTIGALSASDSFGDLVAIRYQW